MFQELKFREKLKLDKIKEKLAITGNRYSVSFWMLKNSENMQELCLKFVLSFYGKKFKEK